MMLQAEARNIKIIKDVLSKYPYTFYAFGSRARDNLEPLSYLNLCFFEDIPWNVRACIEKDFEESNLPYKIDLVDWQKCDDSFRKLIEEDSTCVQASPEFLEVERIRDTFSKYFSKLLGVQLLDSGFNVTIYNSSSGYVFETSLDDNNAKSSIKGILKFLDQFHNQNFFWLVGPSSKPTNLSKILQNLGFNRKPPLYTMILRIENLVLQNSKCILDIKQVTSSLILQDFIAVRGSYNPKTEVIARFKPSLSNKAQLFVGYKNMVPVTIGILYVDGNAAGIFSIVTLEDQRCQGFGTEMMRHLIKYAKQHEVDHICLTTSTDIALALYKKLGFKVVGKIDIFQF